MGEVIEGLKNDRIKVTGIFEIAKCDHKFRVETEPFTYFSEAGYKPLRAAGFDLVGFNTNITREGVEKTFIFIEAIY